jgi:YggT family protein
MRLRYIAVNLLNLFITVVEGVLALRFLFKLFGGNTGAGFVAWIYEMSEVLLQPFRNIFPAHVFENTYVLELSVLFAMVMYAVLAMVVLWVVRLAADPVVVKRR